MADDKKKADASSLLSDEEVDINSLISDEEVDISSPKSNAPLEIGGGSGAQNTPYSSSESELPLSSWTTEANPLAPKIQAPLAKPIDGVEQTKIVQPLGNAESVKNSTKNIATQLKTAIPNSALSVVSIEDKLLGGFTYLAAKLMGKTDEEADIASKYVPNVASQIAPNSLPIDETREGAFKQIEAYKKELLPTKGVVESYKNKDLKGMAAAVYDGMTSIVSSAAVGGATGGIGIATDMMGSSIYDFNKTKADKLGITVDELYDQNKDEVAIPATIGAVGAALEKIGLKGVTKAINTKVANKGVKSIFNIVFEVGKEGGTEWVQAGLESANNSLAEGKTAEEAAKDAINTMTSEQGLEAALKGLVGSAGSVAAGKAAVSLYKVASDKTKQALAPEMDKVQTLVAEKENPNIDDATKAVLDTEIEAATNNIYQSVKEGIVNDLNISDEADSEIQKLDVQQSNLINDYETKKALLDNPNLSEATKAIIASELIKLEAQITQLDTDKDLIFETDKLKRLAEPILKKNTSPTNEKYGTVNRNDGKGIVDLTKEEYLKEEGKGKTTAAIETNTKVVGDAIVENDVTPIVVNEPQSKEDAKKADYTKRIERKLSNASEEKNPVKKALILYEALNSATRVDTGQKENVQELLNAHLSESGLKIEDVEIGSKYNETNTSLDATIAGEGIENLKVVEVLSPIIRDTNGVIVKQGKVIVESSDNKATPEAEAGLTPKTETNGKENAQKRVDNEEVGSEGGDVDAKNKALEELVNLIPTTDLRRPNGSIGTQGFTEENLVSVARHIASEMGFDIPEFDKNLGTSEIKQVIEYLRGNKDAQQKIKEYVIKDPVVTNLLPDGTYAIEDGNHRANLLNLIGVDVIPSIELNGRDKPTAINEHNSKVKAVEELLVSKQEEIKTEKDSKKIDTKIENDVNIQQPMGEEKLTLEQLERLQKKMRKQVVLV